MGRSVETRSVRIAGRARERALLVQAIESAAAHRPSAVFVHGEAGVGKTRLVAEVCEVAEASGFTVLWGSCVRFGAATAPYAPVLTALEHWLSRADAAATDVLAGVDELHVLLASLDRPDNIASGEAAPRLVQMVDKVIGRICGRQPVVLVIDDLLWADVTSLDVLAYLVTGFQDQPLLLVTTSRDEELGVGHPLHGWLADLRRLPSVTELRLDRLDRADTEAQIAGLFGRAADPGLVEDVYTRSAGNAYLTELLVKDLDPAAMALPAGFPTELRDALLAAWHRLTADARRMAQILAVGGRPLPYDDLAAVAGDQGLSGPVLSGSVSEAIESGVLVADPSGEIWFHHPLLAEVLYGTLHPGEAARLHTAFAASLESRAAVGMATRLRDLADLALHHDLAGHPAAAFGYAIRGADAAAQVQGYAEQARQLGRAIDLWPKVPADVRESSGDLVSLLRRASDAANRAGDDETAFARIEEALGIVDRAANPRLAARLLCEWCGLAFRTGRRGQWPLAEALEALALTASDPDSIEHVLALATATEAENWSGHGEAARAYADRAVEAAARCGAPEAMVWALASRAAVRWAEPSGLSEAEELHRIARESGNRVFVANAAVWRSSALSVRGRIREAAEVTAEAFFDLAVVAKTARVTALLAGIAADRLLQLGDLRSAEPLVREGLALRAGGLSGARVRLSAARLAVMSGRLDDAGQHLRRAEELVPSLAENAGLQPHPIYACYLIAIRRPDQALELLHSAMPRQSIPDELLMWGARAAADLANTARDRHDNRGVADARSQLDALVELRAGLGGVPFQSGGPDNALQAAFHAIYTAESARCHADADTDTTGPWRRACLAAEHAGLRWEEAMASRRWAEALIAGGGPRTEIASLLRRAHRIADDAGAQPLRDDVAALARMRRVSLREPATPRQPQQTQGELAGATRRELEVLAHLVTGRSNTEIGTALFISDKTVSVHISNLLRKTGTTNRYQLSALARRLGIGQAR